MTRCACGARDSAKAEVKNEYVGERPVARTHAEAGRKALYSNVGATLRFKDRAKTESAPPVDGLFPPQTRPEFTCRLRWRGRSLVIGNNRCVLPNAGNGHHGQRRMMRRATLTGDRPR